MASPVLVISSSRARHSGGRAVGHWAARPPGFPFGLHKAELRKTLAAVRSAPPVIVRKYKSMPPLSNAQELFAADAEIMGMFGYVPTSQSFAPNNVLTGYAIGAGELTVSYAKR